MAPFNAPDDLEVIDNALAAPEKIGHPRLSHSPERSMQSESGLHI